MEGPHLGRSREHTNNVIHAGAFFFEDPSSMMAFVRFSSRLSASSACLPNVPSPAPGHPRHQLHGLLAARRSRWPVTLNVRDETLDKVLDEIARQVGATAQVRNDELRFRAAQ